MNEAIAPTGPSLSGKRNASYLGGESNTAAAGDCVEEGAAAVEWAGMSGGGDVQPGF